MNRGNVMSDQDARHKPIRVTGHMNPYLESGAFSPTHGTTDPQPSHPASSSPVRSKYSSSYHSSPTQTPETQLSPRKERKPISSLLNNTTTSISSGSHSSLASSQTFNFTPKPKSRPVAERLGSIFGESDFSVMSEVERRRQELHSSKSMVGAIGQLENEVKRLRKEVGEKAGLIKTLTHQLHLYESRQQSSKHESESHFSQLIDIRNAEIELLKKQVQMHERQAVISTDQEVKRLTDLCANAENNLRDVRSKLETMTKHAKELEEKQKNGNLYQIIDCFQKENKKLKEEIRDLQSQIVSQSNFYILERQLHEVEEMQNHLLAENLQLKQARDLKEKQCADNTKRFLEVHNRLSQLRKDVFQLTEIIRIIGHGEGVSVALILGNVSGKDKAVDSEKSPEEDMESEFALVTECVGSLRSLLADLYAEQSGHICAQQ